MQSLHLHTDLQVRTRAKGMQLRPDLQVRSKLRLREVIAKRRSVTRFRRMQLSCRHRQWARFAASHAADRIVMAIFTSYPPGVRAGLRLNRESTVVIR